MKHNQEKTYYELLAKEVLESFLPEIYHDLKHSDKPDLVMNECRGIEVTRAMYENDGQANGLFNKIANKNVRDIDHRHLETFERINHSLLINKDGTVFGHGPKDAMVINSRILKEAFTKKLEKREKYAKIDAMDIFIFSPMDDWLEKNNVYEFMEWVGINHPKSFDNIIVFEWSRLYLFCAAHNLFQGIETNKVTVNQCRNKAYTLVKTGEQ